MAQSTIGSVRRRSCRVLTPDQKRAKDLKALGDAVLAIGDHFVLNRLWNSVVRTLFPQAAPRITAVQAIGLRLLLWFLSPISREEILQDRLERRQQPKPPPASTTEVLHQLKLKAIMLGFITSMGEGVGWWLRRRR
jgi:hypothetical protein